MIHLACTHTNYVWNDRVSCGLKRVYCAVLASQPCFNTFYTLTSLHCYIFMKCFVLLVIIKSTKVQTSPIDIHQTAPPNRIMCRLGVKVHHARRVRVAPARAVKTHTIYEYCNSEYTQRYVVQNVIAQINSLLK